MQFGLLKTSRLGLWTGLGIAASLHDASVMFPANLGIGALNCTSGRTNPFTRWKGELWVNFKTADFLYTKWQVSNTQRLLGNQES